MSNPEVHYGDRPSVVELLCLHPGMRLNVARYPDGRTEVYLENPLGRRNHLSTGRWRAPQIALGSGRMPEEALRDAVDVLRQSIEKLERELGRAEV